ncbi:MAG: homoserine dehydrogenase [Dehalococcoidia bacterium]|nr:homoserine dehydrogenase [Dehalococcoidia bacterium]
MTAGEAAIATEKRSIGVGLIGLGVVGSGVAAALSRRREYYAQQVGASIDVRKAAVRDLARQRAFDLPQGQLTTSVDDVINDPEIDIVVEVMGGVDPAGDYVRRAIAAGKHVVTANKELIAKHGPELLAEAHGRGQDIMFEASVGGGIPLIAPLRRDLLANDIKAITAIINGTSNYILTRMSQEGADYAEALREAQQLGYAEADPTNDVDGFDAAYKLAIMATLGFRTRVTPENIERVGISGLTASDFTYAEELGYVIKLIASAQRVEPGRGDACRASFRACGGAAGQGGRRLQRGPGRGRPDRGRDVPGRRCGCEPDDERGGGGPHRPGALRGERQPGAQVLGPGGDDPGGEQR